jgi:hypothetical protein
MAIKFLKGINMKVIKLMAVAFAIVFVAASCENVGLFGQGGRSEKRNSIHRESK